MNNSSEINLRDLLKVIFRYKLVLITVFIMVMVSVYIMLNLRTPVYSAQVKMLVTNKMPKDMEVQRDLGPGSLIDTQIQLVWSLPIIERVVEALRLDELPLDYEKQFATRLKGILIDRRVEKQKLELVEMSPEEKKRMRFNNAVDRLRGSIGAFPVGTSSMFIISVSDYSSVGATVKANAISRSFVIFDLEQQIAELQLTYGEKNSTIIKLKNHIETLMQSLDGRLLPDIEAIGPATVKIVSQAQGAQLLPLKPGMKTGLLMALIMSTVLGIVLAFVFDYFNHKFKSSKDVVKFLNIPYLGSVPQQKRRNKVISMDSNSSSQYLRSLQKVSNQIFFLIKTNNLKTILFTGIGGWKENAVTVANICTYLSHIGHKVLIIDAGFRKPSLDNILNVSNTAGLTDVLNEKKALEETISCIGSNLYVLPNGESEINVLTYHNSSLISDILKAVQKQYDIVFVSCEDISNSSDAVILSSLTDGLIVFINGEKDRRQFVESAIAPFEQKNVNIVGAVLDNSKYVIPEIIYKLT